MNQYSEVIEQHIGAGVYDAQGRELGYLVGMFDNGVDDYRAYVQPARRLPASREWTKFGATQPTKRFSTQAAATEWAWTTVRARLAKLSA